MISIVHKQKEPYDVYIGRPSKYGNPFRIDRDGDRLTVIQKYRNYLIGCLDSGKLTEADLLFLLHKTLGCWCSPLPCHGEILKEFAEGIFIYGSWIAYRNYLFPQEVY